MFNCITGFYKPTTGRMALLTGAPADADVDGRDATPAIAGAATRAAACYLLERMPDFEIAAQAKVARTFQNIRLFSGMTVLENLIVAQHNALMDASGWTIKGLFGTKSWYAAEKAAVDKAEYWLDSIGLTDRADDPAGELPYGAQRRLEIARAMCAGPVLLCLDEPAAGLNPRESADLNVAAAHHPRDHDTSILLIEHDMSVVMEISDHVVVLEYGTKISDGPPDLVTKRSEGDRGLPRRRR